MDLRSLIRSVPDFPKPGIMFRDVTPLLHHPPAFKAAIEGLAAGFADHPIDCVVGIESRGFMFGSPLAYYWQASFVPARKPGKLPPPVLGQSYRLEYGTDRLEMREQFLTPGSRVLIVDDLIATGGTAAAAAELVKQAGGELCGFAFVIELSFLEGRQWLPAGVPVHSLISYENEL